MEGQGEAIGEAVGTDAAEALVDFGTDVGTEMQLDSVVMAADATQSKTAATESADSDDENSPVLNETRKPQASPQPVWARRNDVSHRAEDVARAKGLLGP